MANLVENKPTLLILFKGWILGSPLFFDIFMVIGKSKSDIETKFIDLCTEHVESVGMKVYDVEFISNSCTLVLYIYDEKTGSAVIENCVAVDRALTEPFETNTWIPDDIVLQVSSPGMYRPIRNKNHLEMAMGQRITCTLNNELGGDLPKSLAKSKVVSGDLKEINNDNITLTNTDRDFSIEINNIKKAKVDPVF
ncbi:MAG: hypothetical protein N4A33_00395 [Bacteriovoracaceae bacterium]|jgi:ribosome maturation factor RimP|nr:hypothetical protein [Bacteriovoracaceae bacterium]